MEHVTNIMNCAILSNSTSKGLSCDKTKRSMVDFVLFIPLPTLWLTCLLIVLTLCTLSKSQNSCYALVCKNDMIYISSKVTSCYDASTYDTVILVHRSRHRNHCLYHT